METELKQEYKFILKESQGSFFIHMGFLKEQSGIDFESSFDACKEYHEIHINKVEAGSYSYKPNEQNDEVALILKFNNNLPKNLEEIALTFVNKIKYDVKRLEGKFIQTNQDN